MDLLSLYQAVAVLKNDPAVDRDRWLDWTLYQVLESGQKGVQLPDNLRNDILYIVGAAFLEEVDRICVNASDAERLLPTPVLVTYLKEGRGFAILESLKVLGSNGPPCHLELNLLLLFLSSCIGKDLKAQDEIQCFEELRSKLSLENVAFNSSCSECKFASVRNTASRKRKKPRRRNRQSSSRTSGQDQLMEVFPDHVQYEGHRDVANLVEYELDTTDREEDRDERQHRQHVLRVHHIDQLQYFQTGDIDSEAVVASSKVIPCMPNLQGIATSFLPDGVTTISQADLLLRLLDLTAQLSTGPYGVLEERDRPSAHRFLTLAAVLHRDLNISEPVITTLTARIFLNCLHRIKYLPDSIQVLEDKGLLSDVEKLILPPSLSCPVRVWPDICAETVSVLCRLSVSHVPEDPALAQFPPGSVDSALCLRLCRFVIAQVGDFLALEPTEGDRVVSLVTLICRYLANCQWLGDRTIWKTIGQEVLTTAIQLRLVTPLLPSLQALAAARRPTARAYFAIVEKLESVEDRDLVESCLVLLERMASNLLGSWDEEGEELLQFGELNRNNLDQVFHGTDSTVNRLSRASLQSDCDEVERFRPYLTLLHTDHREAVVAHLDSILGNLGSEMRLQLATQVVLPFLNHELHTPVPRESSLLVNLLEMLCRLVREQPTAMALIRDQRVWTSVKRFGSSGGGYSRVCQEIIKALVLNSHKFKKIRLSEAEAMALQDDEDNRINFDERDRNAQHWLFKQLYHVLVESSTGVLTKGWPATTTHLLSAWTVTLDLVRQVPEFLMFALERGITDINLQLTSELLNATTFSESEELVALFGTLLNFLVFVVVRQERLVARQQDDEIFYDAAAARAVILDNIFPRLRNLVLASCQLATGSLHHCRLLLTALLESSYVSELMAGTFDRAEAYAAANWTGHDCEESGYEADNSEAETESEMLPPNECVPVPGQRGHEHQQSSSFVITFPESFHLFIDCYLELCHSECVNQQDFLYTLEYLLYRLVHTCGSVSQNAPVLNKEEAVTKLLESLQLLLDTGQSPKKVAELVLLLVEKLASIQLLPSTIRVLFGLTAKQSELQEMALNTVANLILINSTRRSYPGLRLTEPEIPRIRAVSASSSDSGLCSVNSHLPDTPLSYLDRDQARQLRFADDLGQDFAVVLRLRLARDVPPDNWLTVLTIDSHGETVGLHINVAKGLKFTLARGGEQVAAAETTLKSMFHPDKWFHLAFNLGTVSEGKRATKTLTAFVNCQKVWGVGLCVDKLQSSKARKKREVLAVVGPTGQMPENGGYESIVFGDLHILRQTILGLENVILNYLLGPSDLNGLYNPCRLTLKPLEPELADLLVTCTQLMKEEETLLLQHCELSTKVAGHFSPFCCWKKEFFPSWEYWEENWSLLSGIVQAGGTETFLMLPMEAMEQSLPSKVIGLALKSCLAAVTSCQAIFDDFIFAGGYSLVTKLLESADFAPDENILDALLESCSVGLGSERVLLFPDILRITLESLHLFKPVKDTVAILWSRVFNCVADLLRESNTASELNLVMMQKSGLFDTVLSTVEHLGETFNRSNAPMDETLSLLSTLPPGPKYLLRFFELAHASLPLNLLYLPYLQSSVLNAVPIGGRTSSESSAGRTTNVFGIVGYDQITEKLVDHQRSLRGSADSDPGIDAAAVANGNVMSEAVAETEEPNVLEFEENMIREWEILTRDNTPVRSPTPDLIERRLAFPNDFRPGDNYLPGILMPCMVAGFAILSDADSLEISKSFFRPEALLGLVNHPSREVHAPALHLVGLVLERCDPEVARNFEASGGYHQLAGIIQNHECSSELTSAVLSVLHGHPVDVNIPFEFNKTSPPRLNMAVAAFIPPLIVSTVDSLCLGHNFLRHVHELMAHQPDLTLMLIREKLLHSLVAAVVKLGSNSGANNFDVYGCDENELLFEDIFDIVRMVVVFYVDKDCQEYERILDVLFLCVGLIQPAVHDGQVGLGPQPLMAVRALICTILQETLMVLEISITMANKANSKLYFHREDFKGVDQDTTLASLMPDFLGNRAALTMLSSRLNQMNRFMVNFLTRNSELSEPSLTGREEELGLSLLDYLLDHEPRTDTKASSKDWQNISSLSASLLIQLLKFSSSERRKIEIVKMLNARPNFIKCLPGLLTTDELREHFRMAVVSIVKSSQAFGSSEDAKLVALFYGDVLNKSLYPDGPLTSITVKYPLHHASHEPWKAESFRCVSLFMSQVNREVKVRSGAAAILSENLITKHEVLKKEQLAAIREKKREELRATASWQRIVDNLTHPMALWHDPKFDPQSLVLENVTGLSGTYVRLRKQHSGIYSDKFYKDGYKHKCKAPERRYKRLLGNQDEVDGSVSLDSATDQVVITENVEEISPTSVSKCELVLTEDHLYVYGAQPWVVPIKEIESLSKRRYQLRSVALEFFLLSGESHLLSFQSQTNRDKVAQHLIETGGVPLNPRSDYLLTLTRRWRQGYVSNFKYLSELNSLAGRTPNDLMQYPVFPWILADYTSERLNLADPASYRNLRKPIAIQHDENKERYMTTYKLLEHDSFSGLPSQMGPYHYASHYSNTGIVLHLMVRLPPFTQEFIKFQDGNFDLADRSFHKLATSWQMVSEVSTSDVKELIPQLFYLPELFVNTEGFALGRRQNGKDVDSVELPTWAPDARIFVRIHRQALESAHVKRELNHWIDLVFGYKQRGQAAIDAVNVFHPATYAHNLDTTEGEMERKARQTMIATYGQTPLQLFSSPHPLAEVEATPPLDKSVTSNIYRFVGGLRWGNFVGSPTYPQPYVVWQQNQSIQVKTLCRLDSNQVVGLPSNSLLIGKFTTEGQQVQNSTFGVVTWQHSDNSLHCRMGKHGEDYQIACLPGSDFPVHGAAHPKVSTLWLGHRSGRMSVYKIGRDQTSVSQFRLSLETRLYGHRQPVTGLILSPEYSIAMSVSNDGLICTWDLHTFAALHQVWLDLYPEMLAAEADEEDPPAASGGGQVPADAVHHQTDGLLCALSESTGDIAVASERSLTLFTVNLSKICETTLKNRITALTFTHLEEGLAVNGVLIGTQAGVIQLLSSWDLTHIRDITGCLPSPITGLCYSMDALSLVVVSQHTIITIFEKSGSHGLNRTPKYISIHRHGRET